MNTTIAWIALFLGLCLGCVEFSTELEKENPVPVAFPVEHALPPVPLDSNGALVDSGDVNMPEASSGELDPIVLVVDSNQIRRRLNDRGAERLIPLPVSLSCLDDACFVGIRFLTPSDANRKVRVQVVDSYLTPVNDFEVENNAGNVGFVFFLGPTMRVDCFELSSLQFKRFNLAQKHIESYCSNARRMAELSGLDFNGSFKWMVFSVENPSAAAFYMGNRSFVVDEFSLGGQQLWIVLTHEFVHHGVRFHRLPAWFEEGLADYLSYTVNREIIGKPPGAPDIRNWNPIDPALETWEHSRNYNQSAWLIKAFLRDHPTTNLSELLSAYRSFDIPLHPTNAERNRAFEHALQTALLDANYSLDDYLDEK